MMSDSMNRPSGRLKLKNRAADGTTKDSAAMATVDPMTAAFHGRSGRASTTRIQKNVVNNATVAPVPGCQQATSKGQMVGR